MNNEVKIQFLGGAGTVTGSKTLVEFDGKRVLIDCGLFQGLKTLRMQNRAPLPVAESSIDEVILTHAHLDHSGHLPLLVKNGFKGPIHATWPTIELAQIILEDSGKIQEEEAEDANNRGYSRHKTAKPLYTVEEAKAVEKHYVGHNNSEFVFITPNFKFQFHHAGHILGSTIVEIFAGDKVIVFSGDLGRPKPILLYPPKRIAEADLVIMESTYGNRLHPNEDPEEKLRDVILDTHKRGGILFIPTFAVERAQEILFMLASLKVAKQIPDLPIFLDSPMAVEATKVFYNYPEWHLLSEADVNMMQNETSLITNHIESKDLVNDRSSKIVLAGSGMLTGGRILHYLEKHIGDYRNTILLAGFQAEGTRGRSLVEGEHELKFFGQWYPIHAEIVQMNSLSAHADQSELIDWLANFRTRPKKVILNHGEQSAAHCLKLKIRDTLKLDVEEAVPLLKYTL